MNHLNDLQKLQNIKAPAALKEKTLAAAQQVRQSADTQSAHRFRPWMKRSLAAACALALIFGGTHLLNSRPGAAPISPVDAFVNTFGLVAYAVDTGETYAPHDGRITFDSGSGVSDLENGFFSGCLFRITGEHIETVSASIDKGGLYHAQTLSISRDDVSSMLDHTDPRTEGVSQVMVYGEDETDTWYADLCSRLENGFTVPYDPDASYGFWAPVPSENDPDADPQQEWHSQIDFFDGAALSVTATFTDGTSQTQRLLLKTGRLAVEYPEGHNGPILTGAVLDAADDETPYTYGIYAELP